MQTISKKIVSLLLAMLILASTGVVAFADAIYDDADENFDTYISLGADLSKSQKEKVLDLLGVDEDDLDEFITVTTTNDEEYQYLGDYLSKSVIGKNALSSVLVVKQKEGHGIHVQTHNISYCTSGMYENALVTAGITDAEVVVAAPMKISGTAALVGVMKAYSAMTGETMKEENVDTATNELVVSGELAEKISDPNRLEQLIAMIKQKISEGKLETDDEIKEAIVESAKILEIELSDEDIEKLLDLMKKFASLDLDWSTIQTQLEGIYDQVSKMGVDTNDQGLWNAISKFFTGIWDSISDFFAGLFGQK